MDKKEKNKFSLPDSQAREDVIRQYRKNFFIRAAAGAGKTTLMTDHVVQRILHDKEQAKHLVVLTFTCEAAGHLIKSITEKLQQKCQDISLAERCIYFDVLDHMFVGTIHSFCKHILDQYGSFIGWENIDLIEDDQEIERRKEDFLTSYFYRLEQNEHLKVLVQSGFSSEMLMKSAMMMESFSHLSWPIETDEELSSYDLNSIWEDLVQTLFEDPLLKTQDTKPLASFLFQISQSKDSKEFSDAKKKEYLFEAYALSQKNLSVIATRSLWEDVSQVKVLYEKLCDWYQRSHIALEHYMQSLYPYYIKWSRKVSDLYRIYRQEKRYCVFDDLLYFVCLGLKNSPSFYQSILNQHRYYLIDEFQDTDMLQSEILLRLGSEEHVLTCDEICLREGGLDCCR